MTKEKEVKNTQATPVSEKKSSGISHKFENYSFDFVVDRQNERKKRLLRREQETTSKESTQPY